MNMYLCSPIDKWLKITIFYQKKGPPRRTCFQMRLYTLLKLSCSQAYYCLLVARYQSKHMLAFGATGNAFSSKRPKDSADNSFFCVSQLLRNILDAVIEAHQFAQNVDEIGLSPIQTQQVCRNIRRYRSECLREI